MRKLKIIGFLTLALIAMHPRPAAAELFADILYYGVCSTRGITNTVAAGGMPFNSAIGRELRKGTDEVEAEIGNAFGFRFRLQGGASNSAERLMYAVIPPVTLVAPSGHPITLFQFYNSVAETLKSPVIGFVFQEQWQCQQGEWIVILQQGDAVLVEKRFQVSPRK